MGMLPKGFRDGRHWLSPDPELVGWNSTSDGSAGAKPVFGLF